jgi:Tfp pilus assembly protein PilZ
MIENIGGQVPTIDEYNIWDYLFLIVKRKDYGFILAKIIPATIAWKEPYNNQPKTMTIVTSNALYVIHMMGSKHTTA